MMLRRLAALFARPTFHWTDCLTTWEAGDTYHHCQQGDGHDGAHRCQCGSAFPKAVIR